MDIYGKGEQEDLTADQKKILKRLADEYKHAAIRAAEVSKKRSCGPEADPGVSPRAQKAARDRRDLWPQCPAKRPEAGRGRS
jgi:hypothetical protein